MSRNSPQNELNAKIRNISFGNFANFAETPKTLLERIGSMVNFSYFEAVNSDLTTASPYLGLYPRWYNIITFGFPTRCCQIAISVYNGTQSVWIRYGHDNGTTGWSQL